MRVIGAIISSSQFEHVAAGFFVGEPQVRDTSSPSSEPSELLSSFTKFDMILTLMLSFLKLLGLFRFDGREAGLVLNDCELMVD